jgi:hypothetical protein
MKSLYSTGFGGFACFKVCGIVHFVYGFERGTLSAFGFIGLTDYWINTNGLDNYKTITAHHDPAVPIAYCLLPIAYCLTYSLRRLFTGLATAAFTAWKLTVNTAIAMAIIPAKAKIHHSILVR